MKPQSLIALLILIAALAAFTLPPALAGVRLAVSSIFLPVAVPARAVATGIAERLSSPEDRFGLDPADGDTLDEVRYQNKALRGRIATLEVQLADLEQQTAQYQQMSSDVRKIVAPAAVLSGPGDGRATLTIATVGLGQVRENAAVLHPQGLVGTIETVSPVGGTARVRLLTHPQSFVEARFVRFVPRPDGTTTTQRLDVPKALIQGDTASGLIALYLSAGAVRNRLSADDVVLLDDAKFPAALKGVRIGVVESIELPPTDSGHARVRITPALKAMPLAEVLVVTK